MVRVLLSKVRRRLRRKIAALAAGTIAVRPIHSFLEARYARAVAAHRSALPAPFGVAANIVNGLLSSGISRTRFDALGIPGTSEVLSLARHLVAREMDDFRSQADAGIEFVTMRATNVAANPDLYLFGLHPLLLDIAEAYIGLPVAYDGASIQYTPADGREVATRDWHRDREDRRMMKIIVYLNDVDADGGPLQLLAGMPPEPRAYRHLYSLTQEERAALEDGALGTPVNCEGPAGTAVFADTARFFHRGKPATRQARAALFFSYFARRPQRPFFCDRSGLGRHQVDRLVHGLARRQREAALWRDALPLPWRIIPPAPLL
jgi:hypothetical protein